MEVFQCKTKILFGSGALQALANYGAQRLLVVTDTAHTTLAHAAAEATRAPCSSYFTIEDQDPAAELAALGTKRLTTFRPDLLIAAGGSGALDCGKAMAYFYSDPLPLVAIPGSSGSGTEVTDFVTLSYGKRHYTLSDKGIQPEMAILDTGYPIGSPQRIADAGFEILTLSVEAFTSTKAGTITDLYAQEAFRVAYASLPAWYAGQKSEGKLQMAACMAGLSVCRAGTGLCQSLSRALGARFSIPHSRLNAALLPVVIGSSAQACNKKYAQLARAAGIGGSTDAIALHNLKLGLIRLRRELNLPQTLSQAGISPGQLWNAMEQIVQTVLADPSCQGSPVPVEDFCIRRILEEVAGGI